MPFNKAKINLNLIVSIKLLLKLKNPSKIWENLSRKI